MVAVAKSDFFAGKLKLVALRLVSFDVFVDFFFLDSDEIAYFVRIAFAWACGKPLALGDLERSTSNFASRKDGSRRRAFSDD